MCARVIVLLWNEGGPPAGAPGGVGIPGGNPDKPDVPAGYRWVLMVSVDPVEVFATGTLTIMLFTG